MTEILDLSQCDEVEDTKEKAFSLLYIVEKLFKFAVDKGVLTAESIKADALKGSVFTDKIHNIIENEFEYDEEEK